MIFRSQKVSNRRGPGGGAAWLSVVLMAALALASCAPAGGPQQAPPSPEATVAPLPSATPTQIATQTGSPTAPIESTATAVLPAATSRGPNLEASDPATVRLDSGGLQLVEFFRFT